MSTVINNGKVFRLESVTNVITRKRDQGYSKNDDLVVRLVATATSINGGTVPAEVQTVLNSFVR